MGGIVWYPGKKRLMERAFSDATRDAAQAVVDDADASGVVPHATSARAGRRAGMLQESGHVEVSGTGRVRIVYDAPHAAAAYFHPGWRFSTGVNPNAQGRWLDAYLKGGSKANLAHDSYMRSLRRHGKGVLF